MSSTFASVTWSGSTLMPESMPSLVSRCASRPYSPPRSNRPRPRTCRELPLVTRLYVLDGEDTLPPAVAIDLRCLGRLSAVGGHRDIHARWDSLLTVLGWPLTGSCVMILGAETLWSCHMLPKQSNTASKRAVCSPPNLDGTLTTHPVVT